MQSDSARVQTRVHARGNYIRGRTKGTEMCGKHAQRRGCIQLIGLHRVKALKWHRPIPHKGSVTKVSNCCPATASIAFWRQSNHIMASGTQGRSKCMQPRRVQAIIIGHQNPHRWTLMRHRELRPNPPRAVSPLGLLLLLHHFELCCCQLRHRPQPRLHAVSAEQRRSFLEASQ